MEKWEGRALSKAHYIGERAARVAALRPSFPFVAGRAGKLKSFRNGPEAAALVKS
jgi:hypothetical protein